MDPIKIFFYLLDNQMSKYHLLHSFPTRPDFLSPSVTVMSQASKCGLFPALLFCSIGLPCLTPYQFHPVFVATALLTSSDVDWESPYLTLLWHF